jgi:hypothetical protein
MYRALGAATLLHQVSRERSHQVARVRFFTKPAGVIGRCEDDRLAIMDVGDQLVGIRGDDGEGSDPFARSGFFPVLPNASFEKVCYRGARRKFTLCDQLVLGSSSIDQSARSSTSLSVTVITSVDPSIFT